MSENTNKPTSSIVDDVQAADVKASYTKNVPKKIKRLVKKYNKSSIYSPFQWAMEEVVGKGEKWADIAEEDQQTIISISRTLEEWA